MPGHLNLVESDFEKLAKRVLPRFPFCYLTFKCSNTVNRIFEVKDISFSGMQLALKSGEHGIKENENIHGLIRWGSREVEISGNIKWSTDMRLGVEFSSSANSREEIDSFLKIDSLSAHLKPVHLVDYGVDLPVKLKYWLRADGPVEVFVWQHDDGELSKFQILIMENFVEWEDGKGLQTARVISKRDVDTPLISEDEIVFRIDPSIDDIKVGRAAKLLQGISSEYLPENAANFISMKLRS
jgi:hypothetical protein